MVADAPSIAMVYPSRPHAPTYKAETGYGHPAHRGFARVVGATDVVLSPAELPSESDSQLVSDLVSAMVSPIPDRDVYILENDSVLYSAPRLAAEHPEATIILLAAADRLVSDWEPVQPAGTPPPSARGWYDTLTDRHLLRTFLRLYCDGVIAVSELVANRVRAFTDPSTPIRVVHPYIQPAVYERLRTVTPDLAAKRAVTICQGRDHKGIELLVNAWPAVRERHPGAELRIIGLGHPAGYANIPGVTVCGFVRDLATELSRASLYIHPARVEAFGVSVVEGMCAGLPAVVTETTGARVAVSQVDDSLVAAPSPAGLVVAINRYFSADVERRVALSRRSRAASEPYTEAVQTQRFREQFWLLLDVVRQRRTGPEAVDRGGQPTETDIPFRPPADQRPNY